MPDNDQAIALALSVRRWWQEHKYDVTGPRGEWNLYDPPAEFVELAKSIIGDWEIPPKARGDNDDPV